MEKESSSMRERLLARMPQPENVAAYREETASLLARHERALFWEKLPYQILTLAAIAIFLFTYTPPGWGLQHLGPHGTSPLQIAAGILYFVGVTLGLQYFIDRSKVDLLKELKQVQLQVLELQASLKKQSEG